MKILGALSVIIGCGLFGLVQSRTLSRRERCLTELIDSLQYMISELKAELLPLPELIRTLSETAGNEVRKYYVNLFSALNALGEESFEHLWRTAAESEATLALSGEQRQILSTAGAFMGKFSAGEQTAALESCISRLEAQRQLAFEKAREGKKLYPGLGLGAGLMLSVMFL